MGFAKESMKETIIGMFIRTTLLIIGCNLKIGLGGLILATSANIIFVTLFDSYKVRKVLKIQ